PPLYVDDGFRLSLQHADAVAEVRISETAGVHRWDVNQGCLIATEYVATVGNVAKWTRPAGGSPRTIRLLEIGPETRYRAGEEYVAWLYWQPSIARFQTLMGGMYMVPVRNGRVVWPRHDVPELTDGMRVEAFLAALRSVVAFAREPSAAQPA